MAEVSKTLVIVGAGPGLGLSLARRFGREGFRVALIARRRESVDHMIEALAGDGIESAGFIADIGNEAALNHAFTDIRKRFGRIDVLQFSPTPSPEGNAEKYSPVALDRPTMERLSQVQILGAVSSVQAVLPEMLERGQGTIFITTTGSAFHIMPVYTPVGVVMAGLRNYALCLHQVLSEKGVYAATVCIGVLIRPGDPLGDPDRLADRYFEMYTHGTEAELVVTEGNDLNELHDKDMAERGVDWQRPD